jgi:glycosyltransferase involved in cell wall biosynthesis
MKKILFVSANQGGGGSEELWVRTAGHLRQTGHSVRAVTEWGQSAHKRVQQLSLMGIEHHSLAGCQHLAGKALDRFLKRDPWDVRCLIRQLRMAKPDLVVFSSGTLIDGVSLLEAIHEERLPCAVVTHLVSTDNWPDDTLANRIHSAFSSAIDVGFVSEHNRNLYVRQTGHSLSNSRIVRNPFLVSVERIAMPANIPDQPWRLALPARLHPRTKGHDLLFDALAKPEWRKRNLKVTLFGGGGCENTLRTLCLELDISDKIVFAGHVDDMNEVWHTHHALVLPSRHEGLPIAMIEAMWAGRMVIANPAGGIPEMMEPGRTGFLAAACEADALNQAMEEAWTQRDRWESMGEHGRRLVQDRVPVDPVRVWAEHLLELAAQSGRP